MSDMVEVMRLYDAFFWGAFTFVMGALTGVHMSVLTLLLFAAMVVGVVYVWCKPPRALVVVSFLGLMLGALYFASDDFQYRAQQEQLRGAQEFVGVLSDAPRSRPTHRSVTLLVHEADGVPARGRVSLYIPPQEEVAYGEVVVARGSLILPPPDSFGQYLENRHISGTLFYPTLTVRAKEGNALMHTLISFRTHLSHTLDNAFAPAESAFLHGILLGDRDRFSPEVVEKLTRSGTLHITALSGLHMSILVFIAYALFSSLVRGKRRTAFMATFAVIALFVAMTGFKVSAIRASLMAFLVKLADESGRNYDARNALALAALVLTVANPKAPALDLGFQLSFAATIAIIYFAPVFKQLKFFSREGFLSWRTITALTLSAQLGVLPFTVAHFGGVSPAMLPANIALLVLLPATMVGGLLTLAASFVSSTLAAVVALPTAFLVSYSLGIVELFSALRTPLSPELSVSTVVIYYGVMVTLALAYSPPAKKLFSYEAASTHHS